MYTFNLVNTSDGFLFPDLEELEECDTRFDGKVGKFKLGDNALLPGNEVSFLLLSQAYCFGNLGKLIRDTSFYSVIVYAMDGSFGKRLIRLFLRGDNLINWKNDIEKLFYKGVNPYQCLFTAEITGKVKGEHSVFVLNFSESYDKNTTKLTEEFANALPDAEYFNKLPYLNTIKHDAIVLWKYQIDEEGKLIKHFPYGLEAYAECLQQDKNRKAAKMSALRSTDNQLSVAREIAKKYLSASNSL